MNPWNQFLYNYEVTSGVIVRERERYSTVELSKYRYSLDAMVLVLCLPNIERIPRSFILQKTFQLAILGLCDIAARESTSYTYLSALHVFNCTYFHYYYKHQGRFNITFLRVVEASLPRCLSLCSFPKYRCTRFDRYPINYIYASQDCYV